MNGIVLTGYRIKPSWAAFLWHNSKTTSRGLDSVCYKMPTILLPQQMCILITAQTTWHTPVKVLTGASFWQSMAVLLSDSNTWRKMTPECTLCDIFILPEHGTTTDWIGIDQSRSQQHLWLASATGIPQFPPLCIRKVKWRDHKYNQF